MSRSLRAVPRTTVQTSEAARAALDRAERDHAEATGKVAVATAQLAHAQEAFDLCATVPRPEAVRKSLDFAEQDLASAVRVEARTARAVDAKQEALRLAVRAERTRDYEAAKGKLGKVPAEVERLALVAAEAERALYAAVLDLAKVADGAAETYATAEGLAGDLGVQADLAQSVKPVTLSDVRDSVRLVLGRVRAEDGRPPVGQWLEPVSNRWEDELAGTPLSSDEIAKRDLWSAEQQRAISRAAAIAQDRLNMQAAFELGQATPKDETTNSTTTEGNTAP